MAVPISFTVPGENAKDFKEKIREEATKRGFSMSEYIVEAIVEKMKRDDE